MSMRAKSRRPRGNARRVEGQGIVDGRLPTRVSPTRVSRAIDWVIDLSGVWECESDKKLSYASALCTF